VCPPAAPRILDCLGLLHQDGKLPDPEWYDELAQLMFQPAIKLYAPPLFRDIWQVESCQILESLNVSRHGHGALLERQELYLPLVPRAIRKIFLQEPSPEGSPGHLLITGLHQLLHPLPPILCVCHQKEGDK